jgi:3-hydroxybutyryl-CoA dehydrogenase
LNEPNIIGVLGAGTMGQGIAQVCAQAGHRVRLYDPFPEALQKARQSLQGVLERLETKGRLEGSAEDVLRRIETTSSLDDLKDVQWITEAVPERLELKRELFGKLDTIAPQAVLATNTSTLSITAIAAATSRPHEVLGMHFFNPAPLMRLVEVVPGVETHPEVLERTLAFVRALGKEPVVVKDAPGFLVNRVARPFYGEALKLHGEGVPFETVDRVMRGLGFRMGPFELLDLIGIDVNFAATTEVYEAFFHEARYRPHPIQTRMVAAGYLGRKTGRGFYTYPREEEEGEIPRESEPPRACVVGLGRLAQALRDRFGHTDPSGAALVIDARVSLEEKRATPKDAPTQGAQPVVTLVWGHSASTARPLYPAETPIAGFSLAPPLSDRSLVELYAPLSGGGAALELAARFFQAHGLRTVTLPDTPGGVGFRILAMLINEAVSGLQEGVASPHAIDQAMRLGTNYPLGPFEWSERLGLEEVLAGLQGLHDELGDDRYRPQGLLRRAVAAGLAGWRAL